MNEEIRDKEIRVVGSDGSQLGIMSPREAMKIAAEQNLDLVKIAPQATPPVCRIMDYGKYRYEQAKREKEARKNQKTVDVKEVRMSLNIDVHDFDTKANQAKKFLKSGDKVKVSLRMRGREQAYSKNAVEIVKKFVADLSEYGTVDKEPAVMGRNVFVVINPKKS